MLLHGLTAAADLNWFAVFGPLGEAGFRVLSVEHRGYAGGRPLAAGRARYRYRLEDLADDVVVVADELGVERLVAVGYSMGGAVAQLLWRRHPDRVAGLVLGATAAVFSESVRERVLSGLLPAASVGGRVAPSVAGRFVGSTLRARFVGSPWAGWADTELSRHRPSVMLAWAATLARFSSRAWVGEIDVPASVVVTSHDVLVPTARQLALAAAIPRASVVELDGDHGVFVTDQPAFATAIVDACRRVTSG
jgi:3-oxoadipate enol-lactonase